MNNNNQIVKVLFKKTLSIQILASLMGVIGMVIDGAVTGYCFGTEGMAGYGLVMPVITIFVALCGICSTGVSIQCGKYLGSGDIKTTNNVVSTCLLFAFIISVIACLGALFGASGIASLLGADGNVLKEATGYLLGYGPCVPFMVLVVILIPIMQIDGDRNRVFLAVLVMTLVNITLDFCNGFIFKKGLFGMAIATTVSYIASLVVLLLHFLKKETMISISFKSLDKIYIKDMLSYGFPNAIQQICRSLLIVAMNALILKIANVEAVAVYAAVLSAGNLCLLIGTGIGQTTSMIGSVYVGERDRCALRTLLGTAFEYSIILNLAMCLILLLGAGKIIPMFFSGDIVSTNMAIHAFRMFCLSMVFYSVNVTFRNFFQATHNQMVVYVYVITNNFFAILLSALVLNLLFGLNGVWMAYLAGEVITLFAFFVISQIIGKLSRKDADVLERMLMLKDSFDRDVLDYRYYSVSNMNELMEVSEKSREYLESEGADSKLAYHLGLAIEEVGKNIIGYGFTEKKQQWIDVKIMKMNSGWELHIRDDCQLFNPVEYIKNYNSDDSSKNIGLHLVNEISKSMEYTSTLKTNKLVITI